MSRLLTIPEVAAELRCSASHVYRQLILKPEVPRAKVGRGVKLPAEAVAMLAEPVPA